MTESQWTSKLLKELRRRMPDAVIIKFNDRSTSGIPDFCIVRDGVTQWFECKYNNKNPYERLQWEFLRRMGGNYIIVNDKQHRTFKVTLPYDNIAEFVTVMTFDALVYKLCGGKLYEEPTVYDSIRSAVFGNT